MPLFPELWLEVEDFHARACLCWFYWHRCSSQSTTSGHWHLFLRILTTSWIIRCKYLNAFTFDINLSKTGIQLKILYDAILTFTVTNDLTARWSIWIPHMQTSPVRVSMFSSAAPSRLARSMTWPLSAFSNHVHGSRTQISKGAVFWKKSTNPDLLCWNILSEELIWSLSSRRRLADLYSTI